MRLFANDVTPGFLDVERHRSFAVKANGTWYFNCTWFPNDSVFFRVFKTEISIEEVEWWMSMDDVAVCLDSLTKGGH